MTCTCHPNSPFLWWARTESSIFASDPQFRARQDGKSISEVQTALIERKRAEGEMPGYIYGVGAKTPAKDKRLLDYKQFGGAGKPHRKPNKHEK